MLWISLLFLLLGGTAFGQELPGETPPIVQRQAAAPPNPLVQEAIPANNPSRRRLLTPAFGIPVERRRKPVWLGVDIGAYYGQFSRLPYADIFITPYVRFWNLTLAYDLTMRFDFQSTFVKKIWTSPDALISRISVRFYWENPNEKAVFQNISFNISTNNSITLGHGRFFHGYDAAPFAPTETLKTASFSMDASYAGINGYIADIANPNLLGGEFFLRPLWGITGSALEYIRSMRFYATYAVDTSPSQGPVSGFYDFPEGNITLPALNHIETGFEIPIASKKDIFLLTAYGDFSFNFGAAQGYGVAGGLIFTFINIIPLRVEYAQGFEAWSPHFADIFYTVDRTSFLLGGVELRPKADSLPLNAGWYTLSLGIEVPRRAIFLNLEISGDSALSDFQLAMILTLGQPLLKLFSIDVTLTARNLLQALRPFDASDLSFSLTARYHMQPNMSWEILWRIRGQPGTVFIETGGTPIPTAGVNLYQFFGLGFSYRY